MNYNSLKTLAYAYADRQDQEALDRYDDFLRITETRIDKTLKVSPMSTRTQVDSSISDVLRLAH
jgi:hypothetical protein